MKKILFLFLLTNMYSFTSEQNQNFVDIFTQSIEKGYHTALSCNKNPEQPCFTLKVQDSTGKNDYRYPALTIQNGLHATNDIMQKNQTTLNLSEHSRNKIFRIITGQQTDCLEFNEPTQPLPFIGKLRLKKYYQR